MIELINFGENFTDELQDIVNSKNSNVKKIVCTSEAFPEQYEFFNQSGKQIGYFRLRHGHFTVHYPDLFEGPVIYEEQISKSFGATLFSPEDRIHYLSIVIDIIDKYEKENN